MPVAQEATSRKFAMPVPTWCSRATVRGQAECNAWRQLGHSEIVRRDRRIPHLLDRIVEDIEDIEDIEANAPPIAIACTVAGVASKTVV